MIAIKYTTEIITDLPEDWACGRAALALKALAASTAAGNAPDEVLEPALEILESGEFGAFSYQDMKISLPCPTVATMLMKATDNGANCSFDTGCGAWPIRFAGISQHVEASDFLGALEKIGRPGICVPVLRILQLASDAVAEQNSTTVDDSTVISYLCSYYASFDERFQALFYPAGFRSLTTRDAVMFEASSALADGASRTAVKSLSATSTWLGMLVDSSTPVPSLLSDFLARAGLRSGVADTGRRPISLILGGDIANTGRTSISSILSSAQKLSDTFTACLSVETPVTYECDDVMSQQTLELVMADTVASGYPASTGLLVQNLMCNMGADHFTLEAWTGYCNSVANELTTMISATTHPNVVSLCPEAQRVLIEEMATAQDVNPRLVMASAAARRFVAESLEGAAPDHVELTMSDVESIMGRGRLAPDAALMERRSMDGFSVPEVYQNLFLTSMRDHDRTFVDIEDIYAPFSGEMEIAEVFTPADRTSVYSGVTLGASEILAATAALFRAIKGDSTAPDELTEGVYTECLAFVCKAMKADSDGACTPEGNWLASMSGDMFDPRRLGAPRKSDRRRSLAGLPDPSVDPAPSRYTRHSDKYLRAYCTDMVSLAASDEIGQSVIGRDTVIENVKTVLLRRDKSNPLLLAPAGAGKTAVVEGLAKMLAEGNAGALNGYGLYSLDLASIATDGSSIATLSEVVRGILEDAVENKAILFIDEIHMIDALGSHDFNVGNIMKPYLARSGLKVIGATTEREYNYSIAKDKALDRRFSPIHLPALDFESIVAILEAKASLYGIHHGVVYASGTAPMAALLAEDYMGNRESPDRELDVLDLAGSVAVAAGEAVVGEERLIEAVRILTSNPTVKTRADVARELISDGAEDAAEEAFPDVAGQHRAKEQIFKRIAESKLDISSRDKPRNVMMFVGESGVGKTYMACEMASLLDATRADVLQIPLGEYQDKGSHTRLVGASPQYVGYQEGGVFTNFAKAHPGGIVILDEIDKCAPEIRDVFLGVFDTGIVQAANGDVMDCRSMTFVCTANTGHGSTRKRAIGFGAPADDGTADIDGVMEALKSQFDEPLLNRMDEIVIFDPLGLDDLVEICRISYRKLADKMSRRYGIDITSTYSEDEMAADAKNRFEDGGKYDARTAWTVMEKEIVPKAIEMLGC